MATTTASTTPAHPDAPDAPQADAQATNAAERAVAWYSKASASGGAGAPLSLADVHERICEPHAGTRREIANLRELVAADDEEHARLLKANKLPAVTFAASAWPTGRVLAGTGDEWAHTGLIVYDLDHVSATGRTATGVRDAARTIPGACLAFVSPSGNGTKIVLAASPSPWDAASHEQAWLAFVTEIETATGVPVDESGKDVTRLTFLSHDPDAWLQAAVAPRVWSPTVRRDPVMPPKGGRNNAVNQAVYAGTYPTLIEAARGNIGEQDAIDAVARVVHNTRTMATKSGLTTGETERTTASALSGAQRNAAADAGDLRKGGQFTVPTKRTPGFEAALDHIGVDIRFNERAGRVEYCNGEPAWLELTDRSESHLFDVLAIRGRVPDARSRSDDVQKLIPLHYGRDARGDVINATVYHRSVDPFAEYLAALPQWDGDARLDYILGQLFGADFESALTKWAGRAPYVGAVVRSREPGALLREIPVLHGPQSIGKSAYLRSMFPTQWQADWFSDDCDFHAGPKEQVEATLGRVLIELSELAGIHSRDVERVKAFISRVNDGAIRLAYARNPEARLRRFVLAGTTNSDESLPNDSGGNSRFVVVSCPRNEINGPIEAWMDANRPQLWAEAVHLADAGDDGKLPQALAAQQAEHNEQFRRVDSLEDAIRDYAPKAAGKWVSVSDMRHDSTALERATDHRIGSALRSVGWIKERRSVDGRRVYRWSPPDPTPTD